MESPSTVPGSDSVAKDQEKVRLSGGNKPKPHLMVNGFHGYEFMKNGNSRPSAVREYPDGVVPLHRRQRKATSESFASEKAKLSESLRNTSKDAADHKQDEDSIVVLAEGKGTKLNGESSEHGEEVRPALKSPTGQMVEKASNRTLKKMKTGQVGSKDIENALPKSSKLGEKKNSSGELKSPKQEVDAKINKGKISSVSSSHKNMSTAGKSMEEKQSAVVVSQEVGEVLEGKKEKTSKVQKSVTTSVSVVPAEQKMDKAEPQGQTVASETEKKEREHPLDNEVELVGAEKTTESAMDIESPKKMARNEDMAQTLVVLSDQENLPERDATADLVAVSETEKPEQNPNEGNTEAMDLEKLEETKKDRQQETDMVEQNANAQPVKRKSGIKDAQESSSLQTKKKMGIEGGRHVNSREDSEIKTTPSKVAGSSKEKVSAKTVKAVGKTETENGKALGTGSKKRPSAGPDSGEKVKKLPKIKPTKEELTPAQTKEQKSGLTTQQKEVGTPKSATKKSSTTPETSKKARRSGGKPAKPAAFTGDLNDARNLVLQSLRLFDAVRRKFLQDEEKNGKQGRSSRADLQAATSLKEQNVVRGPDKAYGALPGVVVGDVFLFRTELSFIRVHGPIQGGIEYLTAKDSEFNLPVAISIISNVGQDGEDNGEELVYTGQGGRSADNKQIADQKLERGNLAMDGSRKFNVPVRVIRGIKDVNSPTGKVYIYDGLYDVKETYTSKGSGGFDEFKFRLQRRVDQPELPSHALKLAADLKNQKASSRKDIVIPDISKGKESSGICVENSIDEDKGPAEFQYATKLSYPKDLVSPDSSSGCKCSGSCTPSSSCNCFTQNGDEFLYLNGGYLVREKDFVYECGSSCSCSSGCRNRAPGTGLKFKLDVFKTADKGWGVRSLDLIPAGSFVCEYVGKVVSDKSVAEELPNRKYMLSTDWLPELTAPWGHLASVFPDGPSFSIRPDAEKSGMIIDAADVGNVARFINHSCSPNLLVQKVLSDHQDVRYPQFKLFAIDNILPLRELTFDYGYPPPDQEPGREQINCLCGSSNCRGKLYV